MFTVEVGPIRGGGRKGAKRFEILSTPREQEQYLQTGLHITKESRPSSTKNATSESFFLYSFCTHISGIVLAAKTFAFKQLKPLPAQCQCRFPPDSPPELHHCSQKTQSPENFKQMHTLTVLPEALLSSFKIIDVVKYLLFVQFITAM